MLNNNNNNNNNINNNNNNDNDNNDYNDNVKIFIVRLFYANMIKSSLVVSWRQCCSAPDIMRGL